MRRALATTRTVLVFLLALLAVLAFARPALADDPADPAADPVGDAETVEDVGTIDATQPHMGGYISTGTRQAAKPGSLGAGAYDQLPASVDLRAYAPAVGDQGSIGDCVAWTISHSIMGYYANRTGGVDTPYAPLFLYLRNVKSGGAPTSGLNPDAVLANVQAYGVDSQDDFFQGTTNYKVLPTTAQIANATNYKITGWSRLFSGANQGENAQTVIKQALANGMPVAVGLPVFDTFMNLGTHSLYTQVSGTSLGGHMVSAFAYDASGLYLRNQWGTGWGNNGEAHVSWDFVKTTMTAAYTVSGIKTPSSSVPISPLISGLSAVKGAAGTSVTITGGGLAKATGVTFGGTTAQFTKNVANGVTKLVATAPAHVAGTVDVEVTNPTGTSSDTDVDNYTYPYPVPAISSLSPTTGTALGGTAVTLTGSNFTSASAVTIGGASVNFTVVSDTRITVTTPARSAGSVSVAVTTPGGTSAGKNFLYVAANVPTITSLSPSSGTTNATTTVVVTGTNLGNVRQVSLNGVALSYTMLSSTSLRVFVKPGSAGALALSVTTTGGTSNSATFTAVAPQKPVISSLSPAVGLTTATTAVIVTGVGFTGATRLSLGGVAMSFKVVSATRITFTAPKHRAQALPVVIVGPGGTSAASTFTYKASLPPALTTLSVTSTSAKAASTIVKITGSRLGDAYSITSNGAKVAMKRLSSTQIQATLPRRAAGTVTLKVTGPGGTSNGLSFRYV